MWVQSLGREDPLEKEMATHSSTLAWRIPWTEEPGGPQSTGHKEARPRQLSPHTLTGLYFSQAPTYSPESICCSQGYLYQL